MLSLAVSVRSLSSSPLLDGRGSELSPLSLAEDVMVPLFALALRAFLSSEVELGERMS